MIKRLIKLLKNKDFNKAEWDTRINDVVNCSDNKFIPRVSNAGRIKEDYQIMHNGLKIKKDGYYGDGITRMLKTNKGVHEPQEERVFKYILEQLSDKSVMIELGSYWAFYSMWFLKENVGGKTYLFEPDPVNLEVGQFNFKLNNYFGEFTQAFIGKDLILDSQPPVLNVDYIVDNNGIEFIDVLHCDIQGFELDMLYGAINTISADKIGYFLISTHSNEIHYNCLNFLKSNGYLIICEADMLNSYSVDGIIVARSRKYKGINPVEIATKTNQTFSDEN